MVSWINHNKHGQADMNKLCHFKNGLPLSTMLSPANTAVMFDNLNTSSVFVVSQRKLLSL